MPKFLQPQALTDPATALDLVLSEEARLLRHAGGHIRRLRDSAEQERMGPEELRRAFASLAECISEFNADLAKNPAALRSSGASSLPRKN